MKKAASSNVSLLTDFTKYAAYSFGDISYPSGQFVDEIPLNTRHSRTQAQLVNDGAIHVPKKIETIVGIYIITNIE